MEQARVGSRVGMRDAGEPSEEAQSKAGWGRLSLCPPGEVVIVREEVRPKGYSSRVALRASDKGVREPGRKHLAGLEP